VAGARSPSTRVGRTSRVIPAPESVTLASMSEEYASLATPDSCPAPPIPSHRVHNALTPLNGTILGQSKTRRSHGLRKTPGHQVNAVLVPVVPSPDLRELSGRGRSLFHPVGQSEEEYPPTRVIDACRRERRVSLHHTRFLSRVDPNQSLPLSPHQTRESHGGRGFDPKASATTARVDPGRVAPE